MPILRHMGIEGVTATALAEIKLLVGVLRKRTEFLLEKAEARGNARYYRTPGQVQDDWQDERYKLTYLPHVSAERQAERERLREKARDAQIAAETKLTAKLAAEKRLDEIKKRQGVGRPGGRPGGGGTGGA